MKCSITSHEPVFRPVKLTIEIETRQELEELWARLTIHKNHAANILGMDIDDEFWSHDQELNAFRGAVSRIRSVLKLTITEDDPPAAKEVTG